MSGAMNRFSIPHGERLDLSKVQRMVMKYCELCGGPFCTGKDEARFPGDYITLQRGAGKRAPLVCKACEGVRISLDYMKDETQMIQSVVGEIRANKARQLARDFAEEKSRYAKHSSPLRHQSTERTTGERKRRLSKWREPLMAAFKEFGQLTAMQVGKIMGYLGNTNGAERSRRSSQAVFVARQAGIPIVVVGRECGQYNQIQHNLYGLSTNPELPDLTTPRDSVTHKFMKEVKEPVPAVKIDLRAAYRKLDTELYTQALTTCHWNRTTAAKMLGVSYRQILLKIEILGLKQPDGEPQRSEAQTNDASGLTSQEEDAGRKGVATSDEASTHVEFTDEFVKSQELLH